MDEIARQVAQYATSSMQWRLLTPLSSRSFLMAHHTHQVTQYATLYIHSFSLPVNQPCTTPDTMGKQLRYHRLQAGLRQQDVAQGAGINRHTYMRYETDVYTRYSEETLARLSQVLGVELSVFVDGYHLFLTEQGQAVRAHRKDANLTQSALAQQLGVARSTVVKWERGQVQMRREHWERWMALKTQ